MKTQGLFNSPEFTEHRLETIFRTNLQNAFATGRYMEMTAPAVLRRRPYWRFSAVKDSRTTKVCQACAGTILPADHPWWKSHVPPLHFNCRSTFVPMTEKDALAAGITAHPPEVRAALGFGSPPFGVPAAARDMPTEAQREAAEKTSVEVQTAVEERNNASAEVTEAKREKTATAQAKKAAEKAVLEADPEELPARQAELERANEADKKAKENLTKKEKALDKKEKRADAAEEKHEGEPRNWTQVPARLVRLAVGVAAPAVSLWRKLSELFVAGFDFAALGRGQKIRGQYKRTKKFTYDPILDEREKDWSFIPKFIREDAIKTANNEKIKAEILKQPESIHLNLLKTNSKYNPSKIEFSENCQRCVIALEARIRGVNVEALPTFKDDSLRGSGAWSFAFDTQGKKIEPKHITGKTRVSIKKQIEKEIQSSPENSRFIIQIRYIGGNDGHVFNAIHKKGKIYYVDPQPCGTNEQLDYSWVFDEISTSDVFVLRVDNLKFSDRISEFITPRQEGVSK